MKKTTKRDAKYAIHFVIDRLYDAVAIDRVLTAIDNRDDFYLDDVDPSDVAAVRAVLTAKKTEALEAARVIHDFLYQAPKRIRRAKVVQPMKKAA